MSSLKHLLLGIDGTVTGEVTSLCGEVSVISERVNASEEQLNGTVGSTRSVARKLVSGKLDLVEGKASLRTPVSDLAGSGESTTVVLGMVGDVKFLARVLLETLLSVPRHALNGKKSAVGGEKHVQVTRADDGVVGVLNDTLQSAVKSRTLAGVAERLVVGSTTEDVDVGALLPVGTNRSVDGLLNIGAVEVDDLSRRNIVTDVDTSENRPRVRAGLGNVVDVEAGVDQQNGFVYGVEHIACICVGLIRVGKSGELLLGRREGQILLQVRRVVALVGAVMDLLQEGLVEVDDILPVVNKGNNNSLLLGCLVTNDGVINSNSLTHSVSPSPFFAEDLDRSYFKVVVDSIGGVDESVSDIRHVETCIESNDQQQSCGASEEDC